MRPHPGFTALTTVLVATATVAATSLPAQARDGDVIRRGSCSGSPDWKIKASPQDGRIEVESEIDSNRKGQTWRWKLRHNGDVTSRGSAVTRAPSGSFEVRRVVVDLKGADHLKFRAVHRGSGTVCVARVTF